jgi:hypothetical protein
MTFVKEALKAFYAGAIAGLSVLAGLLVNDTSIGDITAGQWVAVALAVLVAFGGVYGITNAVAPKAKAK